MVCRREEKQAAAAAASLPPTPTPPLQLCALRQRRCCRRRLHIGQSERGGEGRKTVGGIESNAAAAAAAAHMIRARPVRRRFCRFPPAHLANASPRRERASVRFHPSFNPKQGTFSPLFRYFPVFARKRFQNFLEKSIRRSSLSISKCLPYILKTTFFFFFANFPIFCRKTSISDSFSRKFELTRSFSLILSQGYCLQTSRI